MKKYYYGVFFLFLVFSFAIGVLVGYQWNDRDTRAAQSTVTTQEAAQEYQFYLAEKDQYVVVYNSDKVTLFEMTDILVDELPSDLSVQIKNGMYITNEADLYDFLESYSS